MNKTLDKFRFYILGTTVDRCENEVKRCNHYNLRAFADLGIVMMTFAIIFGQLMRNILTFNTEFFILWAYFILMYITTHIKKGYSKYITLIFYLWMIPLQIMGIIMGTFGDPTQPSITIMVFLCVLPLFILDKPWRIVLFILLTSIVYTICCFIAKTPQMFVADMIDLVLFTVLGIGVNCLILRDRIHNVEYAANMKHLSETDALTNIYNRGAGESQIKLMMRQGKGGMFVILDVDDFKQINDKYGHHTGDEVLKYVATSMKNAFRDGDVTVRFGGDEFAVYAEGISSEEHGHLCIKRLLTLLSDASLSEVCNCNFTISLGISFYNVAVFKDFETLYKESDRALYQAKREGKNKYVFYREQ